MLSFFPRDVFFEILDLIETVSEGFPSYSYLLQLMIEWQSTAPRQYTYIDDFNDDLKQWKGTHMTFELIIFRAIIYAQKEIPETSSVPEEGRRPRTERYPPFRLLIFYCGKVILKNWYLNVFISVPGNALFFR